MHLALSRQCIVWLLSNPQHNIKRCVSNFSCCFSPQIHGILLQIWYLFLPAELGEYIFERDFRSCFLKMPILFLISFACGLAGIVAVKALLQHRWRREYIQLPKAHRNDCISWFWEGKRRNKDRDSDHCYTIGRYGAPTSAEHD